MNPANPENVPLDKIPAGWRLIYEEEYDVKIPTRLWDVECQENKSAIFCNYIDTASCRAKDFTYITPDLPDNGQPWRAHRPGDPAPVEDGVNVDLVLRDGQIVNNAWAPKWGHDIATTKEILFYRLHESAPMKTESQPTTSPSSDRILSILIAAGHITEEQVEQARKLVKP